MTKIESPLQPDSSPLLEIEDASEPGKPQWLAMLTPAGQLRAHRIAEQRLAT